ncbi:MAG: HU family DNA-binding protein [Candidatus Melainabacteria bacterium]|nr:HU family DNA-binding protein [Candidatus Melainabacteria bacterium]
MNRADLVDSVAKATGQTKLNVHNTLSAVLHTITGALCRGDRVTLVGFGTLERRQRQARMGVNPQNPKQKLRIAAARVPAFRAGQELKDIVDGRAKLPALPKSVVGEAKPGKAAQAVQPKKKAKVHSPKKGVSKKRRR